VSVQLVTVSVSLVAVLRHTCSVALAHMHTITSLTVALPT